MTSWLLNANQAEVMHEALSLYRKGILRLLDTHVKEKSKLLDRLVICDELSDGLNMLAEGDDVYV
jgi:hypothetical protein